MITFESILSCDRPGCQNGFCSEAKATPQEAQADVEQLATERGWVFELGRWVCAGCNAATLEETKTA